jgi:ATP:ADP antiporter, AAA family
MSETEREAPKVRILSALVDVKRNELVPMLVATLWIFSALTAYYIIKPLRSFVLQKQIGVDNKSYALLATAAFVGVFAYFYGKIVPRVSRARLIVTTFIGFIVCIGAFAFALEAFPGKTSGYAFYVWVSSFSLMIVSQFWALGADVWSKEQGKRLFSFMGIGAVAGGVFGNVVVAAFAKKLPTWQMLLLSAALLGLCLVLALYILRWAGAKAETAAREAPKSAEPEKAGGGNAIEMVFGSRYLLLIAAMMLIVNIVNTSNEWVMDKVVEGAKMSDGDVKVFYSTYLAIQNVLTFVIQLLLTARIQRRFGARVALLIYPIVSLAGGLAFIALPTMMVIRALKIGENAVDYSIQSNTRELLYVPTSKLEKYSAKNFNDTFVVRAGDSIAAGAIFVATNVLLPSLGAVSLQVLVGANVALVAVWILVVLRIGAHHKKLMEARTEAADAGEPEVRAAAS